MKKVIYPIITGILLILLGYKSCKNPPEYKDNSYLDTSFYQKEREFDALNDRMAKKDLFWTDSISKINERLKTPLIKWKEYVKEIHDTLSPVQHTDKECCEQIEFANDIIMKQDSLTRLNKRAYTGCLVGKDSLLSQIKFYRDFKMECPVYKKLVWRLYWKK